MPIALFQFELCATGSLYVAEAGVMAIFLFRLPSSCNYRHAPACLAWFPAFKVS